MKIAAIDFSLQFNALDIYVAGCSPPHCKGCHNPELWDFDNGEKDLEIVLDYIKYKIKSFPKLIKNIMIFGGEPLDQDINILNTFLKKIKDFNVEIWLFTKYEINEISKEIKEICDYIKTGKYIEDFKCEDNISYEMSLATKNQKIFKKGIDY